MYRTHPSHQSNKSGKHYSQNISNKQAFHSHLTQAIQNTSSQLKISKHAKTRLEERNIFINPQQWSKIEEKIAKAKGMGVHDSLVIMKDAALIVSAKNNTVITAMDIAEAKSQIFTNINGTILMDLN